MQIKNYKYNAIGDCRIGINKTGGEYNTSAKIKRLYKIELHLNGCPDHAET